MCIFTSSNKNKKQMTPKVLISESEARILFKSLIKNMPYKICIERDSEHSINFVIEISFGDDVICATSSLVIYEWADLMSQIKKYDVINGDQLKLIEWDEMTQQELIDQMNEFTSDIISKIETWTIETIEQC